MADGAASAVHALVVPLHGVPPQDLGAFLTELAAVGLVLVLVDNNSPGSTASSGPEGAPASIRVVNANRGGIAGGFNRGVEAAMAAGAHWITLLDQDSRFLFLTVYAVRMSSLAIAGLLEEALSALPGQIEHGDLAVREEGEGGRLLPTAIFARWSMTS
jgi:hypothetical protein